MAPANQASYNKALENIFNLGIQTLVSELLDGDIVIYKAPGEPGEQALYNVCSVRKTTKGPDAFFAIGQHDYPSNHPEFKVSGDTLVVRLLYHVEPKMIGTAVNKTTNATMVIMECESPESETI